jgi:hypothetical protein
LEKLPLPGAELAGETFKNVLPMVLTPALQMARQYAGGCFCGGRIA